MSLIARCGSCGKSYRVDDALAGKRARCKACGGVVEVPSDQPVTSTMGGSRGVAAPAMALQPGFAVPAPNFAIPTAQPVTPDYFVERPDAYVRWDGDHQVDRWVPFVVLVGFVLALLSPIGIVAYAIAQTPPGTPIPWDKLSFLLGQYLKLLAILVPGMVGVPTLLLMLGVYVSSRVMKFALPDRFFLRCLTVICAPVLIQALIMGFRIAQGDLEMAPGLWWVVSMTLWLGVLWLMFRLRPAPFSVTLGLAFIFCIGIPIALVLVLALAVGIGVGVMGAQKAVAARAGVRPPMFSSAPAPPTYRVPNLVNGLPVPTPPSSLTSSPAQTRPAPTFQRPPVVTPPTPRPARDPVAERTQVEASLKKIGDALRTYADGHAGQFPRRLDELQSAGLLEAGDLRSPRGSPYILDWNPRLKSPAPPEYVLVHELGLGADGKRSALFGDLHIEAVESSRWGDVMRDSSKARVELMRKPR